MCNKRIRKNLKPFFSIHNKKTKYHSNMFLKNLNINKTYKYLLQNQINLIQREFIVKLIFLHKSKNT